MSKVKTELKDAYSRFKALKIQTTMQEYSDISEIFFDLAMSRFEEGLEAGKSIYRG
tara:strand:+ start:1310 stop:1477 length:168 start_codon:yes stop_codon:yes gene_type:complete